MAQKYQILNDSNGNKNPVYSILPRLSATWAKNINPYAELDIKGQFTRFDHKDMQSGNRAVIYPSIQWDFHNTWGYVRPKVGVHATRYC